MKNKISFDNVFKELKSRAQPSQLEGMARFGIRGKKRLGVSMPDLRKMGKKIGNDHGLALMLWKTGIPDAMILAALVDDPQEVTQLQMEDWVKDVDSWDVCDQLCMNLFDKAPFALKKINEWSKRKEEFVKRAAFALIACIAWHDKEAKDEVFLRFLSVIRSGADDNRNFVKKAVSWALRHIGKRNPALNKAAINLAKKILKINSRSWAASDAIRELESIAVQKRLGSLRTK